MILALGFLNAWALWLLPLAAVPIIIHLLNRRRFNTVKWAAMDFLLAAMKRNRRRLRMEHWLILALRTLAVLLLVLLISRPELDDLSFGGVRKHHVIVIDDSASMTQRGAASDAWAESLQEVERLANHIATRREGDLVTILRGSDLDAPVLGVTRAGPDLPRRVREATAKLEVSDGGFDPTTALAAAARIIEADEETEHAEYHVITDFRQHDWFDTSGGAHAAASKWLVARNAETEHVSFVSVGSNDSSNLGITELVCRERVCTAGLPVTFVVEVTNHGLDAAPGGEFTVEIDARTRSSYPLPPLGGGESTRIEFAHTFRTPGYHGLVASLPGDRLPIDDVRAFAVEVRATSRVLLVDGDPGTTAEESETYFLHAALEIRGAIDSGIEVRLVGEHDLGTLTEDALAEFDMVWLCNVPRPNRQAAERLDQFVRDGGGVVFFLGNQVDIDHYNATLWSDGEGILPTRLDEVRGDIDVPQPVHLAAKDDPVFATNTEDLEYMFEQAVGIGRFIATDHRPDSEARALLRIRDEDGAPLLLQRDIGAGRVYMFTSSADADWNSMPVWPVYVMTCIAMHRNSARPQNLAAINLGPEDVARADLDLGRYRRDVSVAAVGEDSSGDLRTFSLVDPSAETEGGSTASLEIPMSALRGFGLFEVTLTRFDGAVEHRLLSRNADVGESRLARLSPESFRQTYPPEIADRVDVIATQSGGSNRPVITADVGGGSLWRWTGFALLGGMLLETLLAWRFGRR